MFMFRLLVYLYDVKYNAATFSPSRAAGYFFMIPNACFPLFPIVDYKTFQRCWYREDWREDLPDRRQVDGTRLVQLPALPRRVPQGGDRAQRDR